MIATDNVDPQTETENLRSTTEKTSKRKRADEIDVEEEDSSPIKRKNKKKTKQKKSRHTDDESESDQEGNLSNEAFLKAMEIHLVEGECISN